MARKKKTDYAKRVEDAHRRLNALGVSGYTFDFAAGRISLDLDNFENFLNAAEADAARWSSKSK